jgi:hypothetical protein
VVCAGVIEYRTYEDMKDALRLLQDQELRGTYVRVFEVRGGSILLQVFAPWWMVDVSSPCVWGGKGIESGAWHGHSHIVPCVFGWQHPALSRVTKPDPLCRLRCRTAPAAARARVTGTRPRRPATTIGVPPGATIRTIPTPRPATVAAAAAAAAEGSRGAGGAARGF